MTSARWLITSQLTSPPPPPFQWNEQRITQQLACPLRDAANTLLNPSLINHTHAGDTFPRRAIARIDVIIADSLFTTVATTPFFFFRGRGCDAEFCISSASLQRRVNCRSSSLLPAFFHLSDTLSLINVNVFGLLQREATQRDVERERRQRMEAEARVREATAEAERARSRVHHLQRELARWEISEFSYISEREYDGSLEHR